jgi:hypothetical protein
MEPKNRGDKKEETSHMTNLYLLFVFGEPNDYSGRNPLR